MNKSIVTCSYTLISLSENTKNQFMPEKKTPSLIKVDQLKHFGEVCLNFMSVNGAQ